MAEENPAITHYALLIGISYYPKGSNGDWRPLQGPVRDVCKIKELLVKSGARIDIQMLTASLKDGDSSGPAEQENLPTHRNVISCLEDISSRAEGTFVYIHFTGHGTATEPETPDNQGSTKDPYSRGSTGDLALGRSNKSPGVQYLRGSELAYLLKKMVDKDLKVTLVLDCCASGSVIRKDLDPAISYMPYYAEVDAAYPPFLGQNISSDDMATLPS
ncbi:hypothetical protein GQ53DRAFT_822963 [Thozetella sp. PMI_491]|nr:hypothetical protein GQ53DRAFT_822963 [Thozetella sp. PMI_491]